jgi:hypothetical protein
MSTYGRQLSTQVHFFAGSTAFKRQVYMTTSAQNLLKCRRVLILYRNSLVGLALKQVKISEMIFRRSFNVKLHARCDEMICVCRIVATPWTANSTNSHGEA